MVSRPFDDKVDYRFEQAEQELQDQLFEMYEELEDDYEDGKQKTMY